MADAMCAVLVTVVTGHPDQVKLGSMRMVDLTNRLREEEQLDVNTRRMDVSFEKEES